MLKNLYHSASILLLFSLFAILPASALPSSYFASESKLAQGKWVKIKVTEQGMQQLTFDELRAMGFENPERVAVFGYPSWTLGSYLFDSTLPEDFPQVATAIYGDKLVFFGEGCTHKYAKAQYIGSTLYYAIGIKRNLSGNESFYFLTDTLEPVSVTVDETEKENYTPVTDAMGLFLKDFRERRPGNLTGNNISAFLVGDNFGLESGSIDIYMPRYIGSGSIFCAAGITTFVNSYTLSGNQINLAFQGATGSSRSLKPAGGYGTDWGHKAFHYLETTQEFRNVYTTDNDIYPLTVKFPNVSSDFPELGIDYIGFSYYRSTLVGDRAQDAMSFASLSKGQPIYLSNLPETARVWNISNPFAPYEMAVTQVDDRPSIIADQDYYRTLQGNFMEITTFDPESELYHPEFVEAVDNQNLHAMETPEMLIVSSPDNMEQSKRLAELHRVYTGTEVAVVDFNTICNEFGSGSRHPMAIRRMAKMFYDRDPERFKAVLLMGIASRDNTGTIASETHEQYLNTYVPMLQCETPSYSGVEPTSYATDAIYGMLQDDFTYNAGLSSKFYAGKLDIKVGRIPASTSGEAMAYINKIEKYLANPSAAPTFNRSIIMPDGGDNNLHLNQAEELRSIINEQSPSTMVDFHTVQLAYGGTQSVVTKQIQNSLYKGASLWNFMGHSTGSGIGLVFFNNTDNAMEPYDPVFTIFATCATLVMDDYGATLQKAMLFNPKGGSLGAIGATRSVYAELNDIASRLGTLGYLRQKPGATFGDVFRDGRNLLTEQPSLFGGSLSSQQYINTLSYNFAGDPMLPMRMPDGQVKILDIDGQQPSEEITFNPYETHQISGAVYDAQGDVDTSFTGTLTIEIYDGNHTENTAISSSTPAVDVNIEHCLLQKVVLPVKDGLFNGSLCVALPSYLGEYNKVNLYAQTADRLRCSVGVLDGVKITQDYDVDFANIQLPVISQMYAIDETFSDGDCVPASFTVYAQVEPNELGFLGDSNHIGNAVSLTLDNRKSFSAATSYFVVDENGIGNFSMPVKDLTDGKHSLTFSVANVTGETSSRTINFIVVNVTEGSIKLDKEFATDQIVVDIEHDHNVETTGRVIITNPTGNVVFSQEDTPFPFTWNLTDNNGDRVAPGIYSASALFKAERRYGAAAPANIIVGRP